MSEERDQELYGYEARLKLLIPLGKAMGENTSLSEAEILFHICHPILMLAEDRLFTGANPALAPIAHRIVEIEITSTLTADQLSKGQGPEEWSRLSAEYARLLEATTIEMFNEFGEPEFGQLYRSDRATFDELYRKGRETVFGSRQKP